MSARVQIFLFNYNCVQNIYIKNSYVANKPSELLQQNVEKESSS